MNYPIRQCRPSGFRTMVALGYVCEGLSIAMTLTFCFYEASVGHVLSALLSFASFSLSVAAIVLIFLMAEKKKVFALRAIQIYLWFTIPYSILVSAVSAFETSDLTQLIGIPIALVIGVPIALYWQQRSNLEYLNTYIHKV